MIKEQIAAIFERVKTWPEDRQEDAVQLLLELERSDAKLWPLTEQERTDLEEAVREMDRGEVASADQVAEIYHLARK